MFQIQVQRLNDANSTQLHIKYSLACFIGTDNHLIPKSANTISD